LFKVGTAQNHGGSDDTTLRTELIKALNLDPSKKTDQGGGAWRVTLNGGKGYLVYRVNGTDATIVHYHWNHNMDGALP